MTAIAPAAPGAELRRPTTWPWWAQALAVYLATRVVAGVIFLVVARTQAANLWTPAAPSYGQYTGLMWDATWYRQIAEQGYPAQLPVGLDGAVQQNALAFFPLFPAVAGTLMAVTGLPWQTVAPMLALLLGTAAALLVHQVVADVVAAAEARSDDAAGRGLPGPGRRAGRPPYPAGLPLATVAVLGVWGAAPVLQTGYTESLALLLLAATLLLLLRRRYLLAMPVVVGLGLTRAVALPLALAVGVHGVARWRATRRGDDDLPLADRIALVGLAGVTLLSGVLWPFLVGVLTGEPDAYTRTQAAWRGRRAVVPLVPWVDVARWLAPRWWVLLLAVVVALAIVAGVAARRLGPELQAWTVGYLAYLGAIIEPGTSLVRFLVLAFPVAGVAADWALRRRRPRRALTILLAVGVLTEIAWVACIWRFVPPTGWPP